MRNLERVGISKSYAYMWANTRKGYWHIPSTRFMSLPKGYQAYIPLPIIMVPRV
jgi:hypothetical protein